MGVNAQKDNGSRGWREQDVMRLREQMTAGQVWLWL